MGYYTYYRLYVYDKDMDMLHEETQEHKLLVTKAYFNESCTEPDLFEDETKWYEHSDNMKEYSLKYPDYIFQLEGEGESSDDRWRKYYHNGKELAFEGYLVYDDESLSIEDFK